MNEKLAEKLVAWQIKHHYLSSEEKRLYQYAYELLIGQAVNLLIAGLLAVLFHAYVTVAVFLLAFIPLRSYAGGHHADSSNVCTIISALMICLVCVLSGSVPEDTALPLGMVTAVVSGVPVFLLAPVADQKKPLDEEEKRRYGRRSRVIWGLEPVVWTACCCRRMYSICFAVLYAHLSAAILLCAGVVKNKRKQE